MEKFSCAWIYRQGHLTGEFNVSKAYLRNQYGNSWFNVCHSRKFIPPIEGVLDAL